VKTIDKQLEHIEQEIQALTTNRESLKKELEGLKRLKYAQDLQPMREVAELAHNAFCGWNHTDGCAWGYEESNYQGKKKIDDEIWACDTHNRWLAKIENLVEKEQVGLEELKGIITAVQNVKVAHPRINVVLRQLHREHYDW
jgi:hypothetical protein